MKGASRRGRGSGVFLRMSGAMSSGEKISGERRFKVGTEPRSCEKEIAEKPGTAKPIHTRRDSPTHASKTHAPAPRQLGEGA